MRMRARTNVLSVFGHLAGPGAVHEDAAHHLRGDAKELRVVLPGEAILLDEAQIDLMNQRKLSRVDLPVPKSEEEPSWWHDPRCCAEREPEGAGQNTDAQVTHFAAPPRRDAHEGRQHLRRGNADLREPPRQGICKIASEGTTNRVRLSEQKFLNTTILLPPLSSGRERRFPCASGPTRWSTFRCGELAVAGESPPAD